MAKKSRRSRRSARRRSSSTVARTVPTPSAPAKAKAGPPARVSVDLREEYRYIYSDLKRLGFLAAGMFALLIALAFIIR